MTEIELTNQETIKMALTKVARIIMASRLDMTMTSQLGATLMIWINDERTVNVSYIDVCYFLDSVAVKVFDVDKIIYVGKSEYDDLQELLSIHSIDDEEIIKMQRVGYEEKLRALITYKETLEKIRRTMK